MLTATPYDDDVTTSPSPSPSPLPLPTTWSRPLDNMLA
jgi:hypothetical protein